MRYISLVFLLTLLYSTANAQELFPEMEPASTIPKGVLGVRAFTESYKEFSQFRNLSALRLMYGLTPKLAVMATADASNHHNTLLPPEYPTHNTPNVGVHHPYRFNGVDFYAKYRFLSIDGQNSHYRMALYGEYSYLTVAHDEGEPTLLDDTKGFGAGLISTYLKGHFAASFNGGIILPSKYKGSIPDFVSALPPVPTIITYPNAITYNLSLGYLLYPRVYRNYNQTNINVYMEFQGKTYSATQVKVSDILYPGNYYVINTKDIPVLQAGNYVEAHPGIQCIIKSNTRIDLSIGYPLMNKSYVHYYPLYALGVQRYFYSNKKRTNSGSRKDT
ncbi:MAG: hypothetical protein P4L41_14050 [Flavipsychrobacter sp.]|nr:hypothetical protein [Flavipsychrobacter sp.]